MLLRLVLPSENRGKPSHSWALSLDVARAAKFAIGPICFSFLRNGRNSSIGKAAACASLIPPHPPPPLPSLWFWESVPAPVRFRLGPRGGRRGRTHSHDPLTGRATRDPAGRGADAKLPIPTALRPSLLPSGRPHSRRKNLPSCLLLKRFWELRLLCLCVIRWGASLAAQK